MTREKAIKIINRLAPYIFLEYSKELIEEIIKEIMEISNG